MNEYPPVISEGATKIAQAYASYGNLSSLYLGQSSSHLQLRLFGPIYEEALSLYCACHSEEREDESVVRYKDSLDRKSLFAERCQAIVENDPLWKTMQGRRHTTLTQTISDPGYVAIMHVYEALTARS